MTLLVVPLARSESSLLTLGEWDELIACSEVLFEAEDHPLIERLRAAGVAVGPLSTRDPQADGAAAVVEPGSERVLALARSGARVLSGTADSPDGLTAAHGAYVARRAAASIATLAVVMARLRSADGCPWDQKQTHTSLAPHLLEEAYEVVDAIDRDRVAADLEEELGDVLLQVAFHAQLAVEDGRFDLATVADRLVLKLLHRHPHVFGDATVSGADEVLRNWETIKTAEKERSGPFDDIPHALPALVAAHKTLKRAGGLGFAPGRAEASEQVASLAAHLGDQPASPAETLGDLLLWAVAWARAAGLDAEEALRKATHRFRGSLA
ncbi:MAG: nucleoside triphosphate pyrophosphohydrolase [Actinomycetota bacterium]